MRYRLTCEEFSQLLDRADGRCEICRKTLDEPRIDHDHKIGVWAVRGLLCQSCNVRLALTPGIENEPAVVAYLDRAFHRTLTDVAARAARSRKHAPPTQTTWRVTIKFTDVPAGPPTDAQADALASAGGYPVITIGDGVLTLGLSVDASSSDMAAEAAARQARTAYTQAYQTQGKPIWIEIVGEQRAELRLLAPVETWEPRTGRPRKAEAEAA